VTTNEEIIPDKSLLTASKILNKTIRRHYTDDNCVSTMKMKGQTPIEKSIKTEEEKIKSDNQEIQVPEHHSHVDKISQNIQVTSNITPYLLLIALSMHGLFEGTALGMQDSFGESFFLGIAIIAHKWAESLALGISFFKAHTEWWLFIRMILLFSIFTPIGIFIGLFIVNVSPLVQGIFFGLSSGTFIYISTSEMIVEEFAITRYRFQKYFVYLCGGILVALLSFIEVEHLPAQ
jgi:zinc transporter ZupT